MKMSEILRQLSDMVAAAEQGQGDQHIAQTPGTANQSAELSPVQVDNADSDETTSVTMVAPLQQKLELLKKSNGVGNVFDQGFDQESAGQDDELEIIKKTAGISKTSEQFDDNETD